MPDIRPELIEKAAKALFDEDSAWVVATCDEKQYHREAAERALLAVADDLRAEAKAEVLREAASGPIPRLALAGNTRAWLRARADQIEHAPRCPHLKCPGGSLCCCADTIEAKEIP